MRIVDEWTKDDCRVTVFLMNGRYSLKVEKNLLEQTFKFRDGQVENIKELKDLLNEDFYQRCNIQFIHMDLNRSNLFPANNSEDSFVEII